MFGAAAGDCSVDVTKPSSLALLDWNAQALKSPQSLYSLTIYAPTFSLQECRYAPVAEARMPLAKFMQPLCESCLETALAFFIPLARSVLPDNRDTRDVQKLRTSVAEHGRLVAASSGLELSLRYLFEHKDVEGLVGN